ncbi:hypothetical protein RchiOBHm_Chr2g0162131 [Rosa chinensis]|uniref:Rapid ALkalinization Factor n=1 Tax=Rosa chinensis TaxID=74649 RepID=A0A2P6S2Y6_ROSCH|nr:hypothetical protein RchiOBHm_Chr2g0162131 [Rosa chinensis]
MGSNKAFLLFALVLLIISSEVAARDLLEHTSTPAKLKENGGYERKLAGGRYPVPSRGKECSPYVRSCPSKAPPPPPCSLYKRNCP